MASQKGSATHSLDQFWLPRVTQTGRSLGNGAYGCVEVLSMDGLECAGKKMFPMLVDPRNEGADRMIQKYYEECGLLSSLRHPNIVQFLGITFLDTQSGPTANLPVLVMEMMQGSLHDFLEKTPDIPLAKKCSILQDVARGLVYLHGHSPVVLHRDLTAKNVLLNSALVAKIADMGNSRIVQSDTFLTASQGPGTLVYMPPEAMSTTTAGITKYNTSLDMFSFGHLTLFTITQVFPKELAPSTYRNPKTRKILGYTEVERRSQYMKMLEDTLSRSHAVVRLVTECLEYDPSSRPSAPEVLQRLQSISAGIDDPCHRMTRLELENRVLVHERQMKLMEPLAVKGLEEMEQNLLAELKRRKEVTGQQQNAADYVESRGFWYSMDQGDIAGNTLSVMIIASVGNQFQTGVEIERRIKNPALAERALKAHGPLPLFMTNLQPETAADLMATASNNLQSSNIHLVRICIDSPSLQRSKAYYLDQIANFFRNAENPVVGIDYLGHSEKDTGNWCFRDGTISFSEVFSLYKQHCPGKLLTIQSDCCHSGQWATDCAKTLDSLGVPPCGHRSRERGVLLRVFASCKPHQQASEPGHSMEAMLVGDDGVAKVQAVSLKDQESTWFSGTKLVCCHDPDNPCPKNTFSQLKWMDGVVGHFPVKKFSRKEQGKQVWRYLMLKDASKETAEAFRAEMKKNPSLKLSKWGFVLLEGEGEKLPSDVENRAVEWTRVAV